MPTLASLPVIECKNGRCCRKHPAATCATRPEVMNIIWDSGDDDIQAVANRLCNDYRIAADARFLELIAELGSNGCVNLIAHAKCGNFRFGENGVHKLLVSGAAHLKRASAIRLVGCRTACSPKAMNALLKIQERHFPNTDVLVTKDLVGCATFDDEDLSQGAPMISVNSLRARRQCVRYRMCDSVDNDLLGELIARKAGLPSEESIDMETPPFEMRGVLTTPDLVVKKAGISASYYDGLRLIRYSGAGKLENVFFSLRMTDELRTFVAVARMKSASHSQ